MVPSTYLDDDYDDFHIIQRDGIGETNDHPSYAFISGTLYWSFEFLILFE